MRLQDGEAGLVPAAVIRRECWTEWMERERGKIRSSSMENTGDNKGGADRGKQCVYEREWTRQRQRHTQGGTWVRKKEGTGSEQMRLVAKRKLPNRGQEREREGSGSA